MYWFIVCEYSTQSLLLVSKKVIDKTCVWQGGGTRLNDIFGQEASNLLMYDGLIILAKMSRLSCNWFVAGKEVCKEGWFPK